MTKITEPLHKKVMQPHYISNYLPIYLPTYLKVVTVKMVMTVGTVVSSDQKNATSPQTNSRNVSITFFYVSVLLEKQLDTFNNR